MQILSLNSAQVVDGIALQPFTKYVVINNALQSLEQRRVQPRSLSNFAVYDRRYTGQDLNGKTLLIFRRSAFGDHLELTCAARALKQKYPDSRIIICAYPGVEDVWMYNPDVELVSCIPTLEFVNGCDYHFMMEGLWESDNEENQRDAMDVLLGLLGLSDTPDEEKIPAVYMGAQDDLRESQWCGKMPERYVVYQYSSSAQTRMYPWEQGWKVIELLKKQGIKTVLVGTSPNPIKTPEGVMDLMNNTKFRDLIPIIKSAKAVICPDSGIGHISAIFPDVPVISLWGPFAPEMRVKHYRNHHPIYPRHVCPLAPCYQNATAMNQAKCEQAENHVQETTHCNVLRSITAEEIVEKTLSLIQ